MYLFNDQLDYLALFQLSSTLKVYFSDELSDVDSESQCHVTSYNILKKKIDNM